MAVSRPRRLRERLGAAIATRLSPERTRRPTLFERLTVRRVSWNWLLRLHRWLELTGKIATAVWVAFIASVMLGIEWRDDVADVINSGRPVKAALVLVIVVPTLLFIALRSTVGFVRWRIQRELWRRDVERIGR